MSKILIVEDEKALLNVLKAKLKSEGFEVITAENGSVAFDVLENETPDLIYLDIVMPEMNGFEFMKRIKSNDRLKNIPIYVLTNLSGEGDMHTMEQLNADGYLVKTDLDLRHVADVTRDILTRRGTTNIPTEGQEDTTSDDESTSPKLNTDLYSFNKFLYFS